MENKEITMQERLEAIKDNPYASTKQKFTRSAWSAV